MDGEHGYPWVYRYIEEPRHPGSLFRDRPLLRPAVPVTFIGPDGPQQVFALVDSGADHILAAPWIAQAVGIDLHQAPEELNRLLATQAFTEPYYEGIARTVLRRSRR